MPERYRPLTIGFVYALFHGHAPPVDRAFNAWIATMYVGWIVLPVSLAIVPQIFRPSSGAVGRILAMLAGTGVLLLCVSIVGRGRLIMPLAGNIVTAQGVGPITLRDTYLLLLPNLVPLPRSFWQIVTAISVLGAVLVVVCAVASVGRIWHAVRRRQFGSSEAIGLFCLGCAGCLIVPIFAEGFFDRYLIPSFPFLAAAFGALIVQPSSRPITASALALPLIMLTLFAGFSVAGTRDYLTWNRARWALLNDVLSSHLATPRQIDGGFEFNGWHLYSPSYVAAPDKSWWWVDSDRYVVAFGTIPGWDVARERTFSRWLPPGEGRIVLLTRTQ
jgi:hypothetical protein